MTKVQVLEKTIAKLPSKELAELRAWFEEFDAAVWDKQFEKDVKSGRLDSIADKAQKDFKKGNFKEL